MDPAFALLYESVTREPREVRCGATLGLGLAYAGTAREDVASLLCPIIGDDALPMDVVAYAALSLGLVFVGTCNAECASAIATALLTRSDTELGGAWARMSALALGLLFLGRGAAVEATAEMALAFSPRIRAFARTVLSACAFAGTGNVLKVQAMLQQCGERAPPPAPPAPAAAAAPEPAAGAAGGAAAPPAAAAAAAAANAAPAEDAAAVSDEAHASSAAVLGIALIALGEDLGAGMAARALEHVLQYGDGAQRKAVPLALALLSSSNPTLAVTDALGRLAHDPSEAVASAAVLGLGLAAAGTNNARVAGQLRQLSSYYYKEPSLLYLVRVSQGLVHLGKGLLSLHPLHADRGLLHAPALAALALVAFAGLDMGETLLGKHACLLYALAPAMRPRMLLTVDADGKPLPVPVRVGEALDTVAQAGRPKSITGFQTHTTPVLLAVGDRAELASEQYVPTSPLLEGVIILQPNPEWVAAKD
jgi:26S proteasome regulatory subunit N1